MRQILNSIESEFGRYRGLADGALEQLDQDQICRFGSDQGNTISVLVWHLAGNLKSRFTDFLTSDGEKPWRNRDSEFLERRVGLEELREKWDEGWRILFETLQELTDEDLTRTVTIRGTKRTVLQALHRALAHAAYHVGQMVYLARAAQGDRWRFLSIPLGESDEYNRNPTRERG